MRKTHVLQSLASFGRWLLIGAMLGGSALMSLAAASTPLKLHALFTDHMVLQQQEPIKIWGWARPGRTVEVTFGTEKAQAVVGEAESIRVKGHKKAFEGLGRWEVSFPPRKATAEPVGLAVSDGEHALSIGDILIGEVWVAHGQSNMGWGIGNTLRYDLAVPSAEGLPLVRHFGVSSNTQATVQDDLGPDGVDQGGWVVANSETVRNVSAIGHHFGATLQQALQVPVGIICNSRGGASIESMVPGEKFDEHPLTKAYYAELRERMENFDHRAEALEKWERDLANAKKKKRPKDKWPKKPEGFENLSSWAIPGVSPADGASVWNGMVAPLKGIHFRGMIFHQGYNNTLGKNYYPRRYRVLMKLMVEGWRETFEKPDLPVGVIGFCAGGNRQHEENFEVMGVSNGAFIREAQRLGLGDVANQKNLQFLPAYDVQYPGLHPGLKYEHGMRSARWALSKIYKLRLPDHRMNYPTAKLESAEPSGDEMILKFTREVMPVHRGSIPRGFAIAGEDGKFYRAHARYRAQKKQYRWDDAQGYDATVIHVWSPLVEKPVAVRYAWATNPVGNLKVGAHPDCPFYSFRTDDFDPKPSREKGEAEERLKYRKLEEARRAMEIVERLETLGRS